MEPLRLPPVPAPNGVRAVSPCTVLTWRDVDAERVGGELDGGGFEAVARRPAGEVDVDRAGWFDADGRAFAAAVGHAAGGRLDVARGADAEVATCGARRSLLGAEPVVVDDVECHVERFEWRHVGELHPVCVRVRQLVLSQ